MNRDIFEIYSDVPYYQSFIEDPKYMKQKYNRSAEIVEMTPQEYYDTCAKMFGTDSDNLKKSRERDRSTIEELEGVLEDGNKFPITHIDPTEKNQEGLHRMYAAGEIFGWNSEKFPVLIVSVADKKREESDEKLKEEQDLISKVDNAFYNATKPKYLSKEEFAEEFMTDINESLFGEWSEEKEPTLKIRFSGNSILVDLRGYTIEYDVADIKYETQADRDREDEELMKQLQNTPYDKDDMFEE